MLVNMPKERMRKWVAEKHMTTTYTYEVVNISWLCNVCGVSTDVADEGKKSRAAVERFKAAHQHGLKS